MSSRAQTSQEEAKGSLDPQNDRADRTVFDADAFDASRPTANPYLAEAETDAFHVEDTDEWAYVWKRVALTGEVDADNLHQVVHSKLGHRPVRPDELPAYAMFSRNAGDLGTVIRRGDLVLFKYPMQNRRWYREAKEVAARRRLSSFAGHVEGSYKGVELFESKGSEFKFI